MFLSSPHIYSQILYVIAAFSFPIHLFGGYCILFKTPKAMRSVKWTLFIMHFWASLFDLSISFFGQPFICTPVLAGFPLGLWSWLEVDTGIVMFLGFTTAFLMPISVIKTFENRYYILFADRTVWRYFRYPFFVLNYILSISSGLTTYFMIPEQSYARSVIFERNPDLLQFDFPESPILVLAIDNTFNKYRQFALIAIFISEIMIFVLLIRWNTNNAMKDMKISPSTLRLQKNFMRALNYQIAIPIILLCIPSVAGITIPTLIQDHQAFNNFVYVVVSFHGVLSTFIMVYLQKPYRDVVLKMFGVDVTSNIRVAHSVDRITGSVLF
ncbi:Serpentine Receptor, class H [Caenorhabditis elegans]|uniref:Serpentine Receptor, class H n=1 Tax=Caenorhabditis elegans TaxID=6239 RepID=Q7YTT8_CAEEL|nr:Serpentine Receptor, class H [Caenorhabditis elegans]CAE11295.1 Serpentine Receptor, class H [Caenorhabditis elegans]|eukprot:NP_001023715.1 Serpentine Receptor, class H [Caenorhabditis elegans]